MQTLTIINAIANLIIAFSVTAFIIFVFGRFTIMDKLPKYESFLAKAGLSLTAAGAFFNFLTLSTPQLTEIVLNCGLAITFCWAAVFHYNYFVRKNKVTKKPTKKSPKRR